MLTKRIIPCLDIDKGRVVKGTNFVDIRDAGDPLELAKLYYEMGADELVFLDITASSDNRGILLDFVKRTAEQIFIPFTVGGGISSLDTIQMILDAGADKVSINTSAVKDYSFIQKASTRYGSQCIVVAIDARSVSNKGDFGRLDVDVPHSVLIDTSTQWEVFTHGGRNRTGIDALKWAVFMDTCGAGEILLTSMDKDGTKSGYDLSLTDEINEAVRIPVIASGGAGSHMHIIEALDVCDAALLASLLHFQETSVSEIKQACLAHNIPVRAVYG